MRSTKNEVRNRVERMKNDSAQGRRQFSNGLFVALRFWPLLSCLWLCVGCDSVVVSHLTINPGPTIRPVNPKEVVPIVHSIVEMEGFGEFVNRTNPAPSGRIEFTNWGSGHNPSLFITVSYERWPVNISFFERYTSHKSRMHKKVVKEIEAALTEQKFKVTN
jgi:hypothetical protein